MVSTPRAECLVPLIWVLTWGQLSGKSWHAASDVAALHRAVHCKVGV